MAIFKCKMCGGALEINEDITVAECEYCGTKQTVPTADSEKKISLFTRANKLRAACEFDKAAGVYESIVTEFPEEAEAYWGLILCNYGIEYVDDPATGKKLPTCHRSSFDSVMDSNDFEMVMENADSVARKVYRDEAKAIEELRKSIIEVSSKEEPYDIFICYKETDENGDRTIDSVIAQDVYTELTDKGYRVFFSRITLEDKLGQEYEPYIFAALNSAKVMLAFGTDYEYYNAVWVKNEWSRFLQLIAKGEKKTLIPCYKNIDAYDMPKEFAKLQAQDMGKVGAIQDLLRGIEKIIPKNVPSQVAEKVTVTQSGGPNVEALLKRGNNALEDSNFTEAKTHFNKVLDINAECAEAYLGLAMADEKVRTLKELLSKNRFNKNYLRAKQYASGELAENISADEQEFMGAFENKKNEIYECRKKIMPVQNKIAAATEHSVAVDINGTVLATKYKGEFYQHQCDTKGWKDIIAITAGKSHTVGLKSDGTVIATKSIYGDCGQSDVYSWHDIIAISAGEYHTVGLKKNGTVVATKYKENHSYSGFCEVSAWHDIIEISAGNFHTVGLKKDGTVVATKYLGQYYKGQCDVSDWKDIISIACGSSHTVGLKSDGTVVATGFNKSHQCDVGSWNDIIAISAGSYHTIGLKKDGTIISTSATDCDCTGWKNIVAISGGFGYTIGLKKDGTVVSTKIIGSMHKNYGQFTVNGWKLFDNYETVDEERKLVIEKRKAELAELKRIEEEKRLMAEKRSLLKDAILNSNTQQIIQLLETGAEPNSIEYFTDKNGKTVSMSLLSIAVNEINSLEITDILLKHGAVPDEAVRIVPKNGDKYSVLSDAIFYAKSAPIVELLLKAGADPNKIEKLSDSNGKPVEMSMLAIAICEAKDAEIVKLLIEYGADINKYRRRIANGDIYSALADAIFMARSIPIAEMLLKAGADPNKVDMITASNGKQCSYPMLAFAIVDANSAEMVELLLEYGADIKNYVRTNKDGDKYSALSDAIFVAKSAPIVELLLKAGADPNKVETIYDEGKNSRLSMLSYAIIMAQSTEIVELLIKYGAHWNNEIKLNGVTKIEKKYPYDKRYKLSSDLIRTLKSNGWKGSLF